MFSGVVEALGHIVSVEPRGNGRTLRIRSALPVAPAGEAGVGRRDRERIGLGDSVAVNGACLTVEAVAPPDTFTVAAGAETLSATTTGALRPGDPVHLERALRVGDRLDGHLVAGHVDGVGTLLAREPAAESLVLWVEAPAALGRYIAVKGSICIDGVSLTVNELDGRKLRVNIVPWTARETRLGALRAGDPVNLEVDLLARYLERLLAPAPAAEPTPGLGWDHLAALGYGRSGRGG
jgi:riboflavin synthase